MDKRGTESSLYEILLYLVLFLVIALVVIFVFKEKIFAGGAA
jgi:hypothetical protein